MIICSSSNIDLIQGVTGYGTAADGATDWRIENTATGVFNVLNSPNLLAPNLSIIESGNVGIGTIPGTGTNKLQVQGNANVSGDTLSKTYTATNTTAGTNDIFTMRYDTTNGLRFQQTLIAVNDVRYDVIQKTNNVDSTTPAMSFYKGNVGIGTTNPNAELQVTCASTATNPDTPGTIIGLYVHNPTNSASQNSVIYNRIGGTSAGKVIYAFNVLSSYGCSLVINGNDTTDRLLRFNNSSDASGTDLMVINNSNGNVSIGNTTTGTHKLNVTGSVNVSGGYLVGGNAFKPATAVLADTATVLAANRNIAGVPFNGSGAIDIPYPNLTNKLTSGTGITISAATPPVISTNLTAGTNVTFTGTAPNITINASGGTASQWTTTQTGNNIYYNTGSVGIGTNAPFSRLHLHANATTSDVRMIFSDNTTTASDSRGFTIGKNSDASIFLWNYENTFMIFATNSTERLRITSNGNVGIGTSTVDNILQVGSGGRLTIANNNTGRTVIGTNDLFDANNTRISIYGNNYTNYIGNIEYIASSTGNHIFFCDGGSSERFRISSNGSSITFKPDVWNLSGGDSYKRIHFGSENRTYISGGNNGAGINVCTEFRRSNDDFTIAHIRADGTLQAHTYVNFSDRRIKKDIEDINDETALNMLLLIQPKTYNYIDEIRNKGFGKVYGFIAQQINEVIPEATTMTSDIIPNIYKNCSIKNKREVYQSIPVDVAIDTDVLITIEKKGGRYKIKEIYDNYFVIDKDIDVDEAFVYGYSVDDVFLINKDYIFTINVCATQELHRKIETQNVIIKSQDDRIKDLEAKVEMLLSNTK